MKSIVEEASSVLKAIEKGWIQAGKPLEFSVKVFEVEQKNFLGLTSKSAKIALFFNEKSHEKHTSRMENAEKRAPVKRERESRIPKKEHSAHQEALSSPRPNTKREEPKEQSNNPREVWSEEMITFCQTWLKNTLQHMGMDRQNFAVDAKNYYLKITFEKPLMEDVEREKLLFRSFAHLVMQSLRNKFKKGFRGFKIILNSGK